MLSVSSAFRDVLENENKKYNMSGSITLKNSTVIPLSNSNIIFNGVEIDDALCSDEEFGALGAVPIAQLNLILDNRNNDYTNVDFYDAEISISVGVTEPVLGVVTVGDGIIFIDTDSTNIQVSNNQVILTSQTISADNGVLYANDIPEYVYKGAYIVDDVSYNGASVNIKALDFASKLDRPYTDTNTLIYPATLAQIARSVCSRCNLILETTTFPNSTLRIPKKPDISVNTTFREVLSWVATLAGCFVKAVNGRIELRWFDTDTLEGYEDVDFTSDSYTPESAGMFYFSSVFNQSININPIAITGIKIDSGENTYFSGTDGYVINIDNNELFNTLSDSAKQDAVDYLADMLVGVSFYKTNIQHLSDPTIEAGDIAVVHDAKKDKDYPILITRTNFAVYRKQTTVCGAQTPNARASTRYSVVSKAETKAAQLVEEEKTQRELAEEEFARQLAAAGGMYTTDVETPAGSGSYIRYLHNKQLLAESQTQVRIDNSGVYISNDYGQTWPYGLDYGGNTILNKIYAIGIDADYVTTGSISSAISGFGFDLDNGTGNIGGWLIDNNMLTKTITWDYPANTFTAADATAASQGAAGNAESEYDSLLEQYDVNHDGILDAKDVSAITRNANGSALSFSRTITLNPNDNSAIVINSSASSNVLQIDTGRIKVANLKTNVLRVSDILVVDENDNYQSGISKEFDNLRFDKGVLTSAPASAPWRKHLTKTATATTTNTGNISLALNSSSYVVLSAWVTSGSYMCIPFTDSHGVWYVKVVSWAGTTYNPVLNTSVTVNVVYSAI